MNSSVHEPNDLDLPVQEPSKVGGKGAKLPFDPLRLVDALTRNALWIILAGIAVGAIGMSVAMLHFRDEYTATIDLIRQEPPNAFRSSDTGESFKPRVLAAQTLVGIMKSPALLQRVVAAAHPTITPGKLIAGLTLTPERGTDLIRLEFKTSASSYYAAAILNRYAEAVTGMTRTMQSEEAASVASMLKQQLARATTELDSVNAELLAYGKEAKLLNADKEIDAYLRKQSELDLKYETTRIEFETIQFRITADETALAKNSPGASKLQTARDDLTAMLSRFTEANPMVKEQRAKVEALEKQELEAQSQTSAFPQASDGGVVTSLFLELLQLRSTQKSLGEQVKKLNEVRAGVAQQLSTLPEKQMHSARIHARKQSLETERELLESRLREAELFVQNSLGFYRVLAPTTPDEVALAPRKKKVMILAILGLLAGAGLAALWFARRGAFDGRARTAADLRRATGLDVLASQPATLTLLSQRENWAFRTWTSLRGRVSVTESGGLVGFLSHAPQVATRWVEDFADAAHQRGQNVVAVARFKGEGIPLDEALQAPERILSLLAGNASVRLIIGEEFGWTSEKRSRWHRAAQLWQDRARAVVLLEVTAPGESESVLLCERLPEIIVVAKSGESSCTEIAEMVEPYRDAGCNLAGAALASAPVLRPEWLARKLANAFLFSLLLGLASAATMAAEPSAPRAKQVKPAWLEHFTLGPGDGFSIGIYGHPEIPKNDVFIGADGRVTYLQAHGILAAGLTVDELRARMNAELAHFYQNAQVVVSPIAFQSKRVFVLGKVVDKGAINLDRPLTLLEAVAEAGGLETGLYQQNTVELADLPRSLLVRRGQRLSVNFERLFFEGDMSQNVPLEPDDYLFFPSSSSNELHILGSVHNPGAQGITSHASVVSAITTAGGFTDKAWRKRVLVVRGSLSKPQCFIVNVDQVVGAQAKDFRLEPSDIVYVSDRPWAKVEELTQTAINAFAQAAVATWTGGNIGPIITRPILPQL